MRKVVVQQFATLDGFAAGPNGELDFVTEAAADPTSGPFVEDQLAFIESLDTILLGAVTYRMFAEYWPEQTTEMSRTGRRVSSPHWHESLSPLSCRAQGAGTGRG